jgi:hypothetical protein
MEHLNAHLTRIRRRMVASVAMFVLFVMLAMALALRGAVLRDETMLIWMVPFVLSILLLPRSTSPPFWPRSENESDQDHIDMIRANLRNLQSRAMIVRLAFLAVAAVIVFAVPRMLNL